MVSTKNKTQTERPWFPELEPFSMIEPKPIDWLWEYMVPKGMVTVIEGWPGVGKSQVALDIMARLSDGDCMPFTGKPTIAGGSILIAPEDPVESVVWPRLQAAAANMARVYHLKGLFQEEKKRRFTLSAGNLEILRTSIQDSPVELVYVDAVMGLLDGADANSDQEVRGILEPLAEFADKTGIAVLIGRHWSKGAVNRAAHEKGIGSIAWSGVARSVLQVGYHPDNKEIRLLCLGKKNLAPDQGALSFRLDPVPVLIGGQSATYTRIEWLEVDKSFDVQRLGTVGTDGKELSEAKAEEWVLAALEANGEMLSRQLDDMATKEGLGTRAVKAAKAKLKDDGKIRYRKNEKGEWKIVPEFPRRPLPTVDDIFPNQP